MTVLTQNLKFALRLLRKAPGFAFVAVFIMALGIGANTAIFSVVHAVLLEPLPFPDADRLVQIWHVPPQKQLPRDDKLCRLCSEFPRLAKAEPRLPANGALQWRAV